MQKHESLTFICDHPYGKILLDASPSLKVALCRGLITGCYIGNQSELVLNSHTPCNLAESIATELTGYCIVFQEIR